MYQANIGALTYADGTIWEPTPVHESGNGWVYKPDVLRTPQEIRSGKNKSFPRKTGHSAAKTFIQHELREHFESRNWEKPTASSRKRKSLTNQFGDSLLCCYWDEAFGYVTLSLAITQRQDQPHELKYSVSSSSLFGVLLNRDVTAVATGGMSSSHATVIQQHEYARIEPHVEAFIKDPWGEILSHITRFNTVDRTPLKELLTPPVEDLFDLEYSKNDTMYPELQPGDVYSASYGNGLFFKRGVIEKVLQKDYNWEVLEEFFKALEFVGVKVRPKWAYDPSNYRDKMLRGITIEIPKQGDTHEHTVTIHADDPHAEIACGYLNDDSRWVDRKQREAAAQMAELEADLKTFGYEISMLDD